MIALTLPSQIVDFYVNEKLDCYREEIQQNKKILIDRIKNEINIYDNIENIKYFLANKGLELVIEHFTDFNILNDDKPKIIYTFSFYLACFDLIN